MSAIKTQCCWAKLPKLSNSLLVSRCLALTLFSFGVSLSLLFWCLAVSRSLPLFKQLLYCFSLVSVWLVYPTTDLMSIPLLTCVSLVLRVSSPPPSTLFLFVPFSANLQKLKKLDLSRNRLQIIPVALMALLSLDFLLMNGNRCNFTLLLNQKQAMLQLGKLKKNTQNSKHKTSITPPAFSQLEMMGSAPAPQFRGFCGTLIRVL